MELRNLDKKIGRRKQVLDTLEDSPIKKSMNTHQKTQLRRFDKELEKKSLQLRQINHHLQENNRVWRKVKADLENFGEYKLRLKEIVEEYEVKIEKIKQQDWEFNSPVLSSRSSQRDPNSSRSFQGYHRREPKFSQHIDVNRGNVVDHISNQLDVALSSFL